MEKKNGRKKRVIKIVINGKTVYSDSDSETEMREALKQMYTSFFNELPFGRFLLKPPSDIYRALQYFGFSKMPSEAELRTAFRAIAVKTHPDSAGSEKLTEKFVEAKKHYDVLVKELRRG